MNTFIAKSKQEFQHRKINATNCSGCIIFEGRKDDNMIEYNTCHKKTMVGCDKHES